MYDKSTMKKKYVFPSEEKDKNNQMMNKKYTFQPAYICFILLGLSFLTFSCKKHHNNEPIQEGKVKMNVTAQLNDFVPGVLPGENSSSKRNYKDRIDTLIQINKDYYFEASLVPDDAAGVSIKKKAQAGNKAVTEPLTTGVYYQLLVFEGGEDGKFLEERTYRYGREAETEPLLLDGGKQYTFVAHSANSITKSNLSDTSNIATLKTAQISFDRARDILFFTKTVTLSGAETENLNIEFHHQLNLITVVIDATPSGANIMKIDADIVRNSGMNYINLGTGVMRTVNVPDLWDTSTGYAYDSDGGPGEPKGESEEDILVAVNPIAPLVLINLLKVGNFEVDSNAPSGGIIDNNGGKPLELFPNANLEPGKIYKVIMKVTPSDRYVIHEGEKAALINGNIWLRHNVGADKDANPDVPGIGIQGNYYQWGKKNVIIDGTRTGTVPIPDNWSGVLPTNAQAWNDNSSSNVNTREDAPEKNNTNDPCPTGYRVPTAKEMNMLALSTVLTYLGTNNSSPTNFNTAAVFTSRRNANVKLTFPKQGEYSAASQDNGPFLFLTDSPVWNRGNLISYWTSYYRREGSNVRIKILEEYGDVPSDVNDVAFELTEENNNVTAVEMKPIRCIGISKTPTNK